jgi:hypothetical protein
MLGPVKGGSVSFYSSRLLLMVLGSICTLLMACIRTTIFKRGFSTLEFGLSLSINA